MYATQNSIKFLKKNDRPLKGTLSFNAVITLKVVSSTNISCTCVLTIFSYKENKGYRVDEGFHTKGQPLMNLGR